MSIEKWLYVCGCICMYVLKRISYVLLCNNYRIFLYFRLVKYCNFKVIWLNYDIVNYIMLMLCKYKIVCNDEEKILNLYLNMI